MKGESWLVAFIAAVIIGYIIDREEGFSQSAPPRPASSSSTSAPLPAGARH